MNCKFYNQSNVTTCQRSVYYTFRTQAVHCKLLHRIQRAHIIWLALRALEWDVAPATEFTHEYPSLWIGLKASFGVSTIDIRMIYHTVCDKHTHGRLSDT